MKKLIHAFVATILITLVSAAGVTGKVSDQSGTARSGVVVLLRFSNQKIQTSTDKDGNYLMNLHPSFNGSKARVYVNGKYTTTVTVPQQGYAVVNVTYKK